MTVKARVKGATWLRHAARARGMPIYALKVEGMPQLARAMQAMLGLNGLNKSGGDDTDDDKSMATATNAAVTGSPGLPSGGGSSSVDGGSPVTVTPADEVDALEEVRMAVEQLVIPHREPVELLPRDERLRGMQAALITGEYRLTYETCGEGNSARIKILHTYIGS